MKGIANRQNTLLGRKLMVRTPRPGRHPLETDRGRPVFPFPKKPKKEPPKEPDSSP